MRYFEEEKFTEIDGDLFENSEFIDCTFEKLDLTNVSLKNTKILESQFKHCNLSGVSLLNATISDCKFSECKLTGVNWSNSKRLNALNFSDCLMHYNVFQEVDLQNAIFKKADLKESDFSNSRLMDANFEEANLLGAIFNGSDLRKADLRGAKNYLIDPKYTLVKGAKFSLPEALSFLKSLEINVE